VLLGRYNGQGMDIDHQTLIQRLIVAEETLNTLFDESNNNVDHVDEDKPPADLEIWIRITPGKEYVKAVVYKGKIIGSLLIGDTDLEETMENLILNRLDVSRYGVSMLDANFDIADYFD
jgi:hypothetical protein